MSELTERFKNLKPWASTWGERETVLRQRATMPAPEGEEKENGGGDVRLHRGIATRRV
jgi:hypothetical protein